jgi:hypothetical protein
VIEQEAHMLPLDPLAYAHERARALHEAAAAERLLPRSRARTRLASSLRRAADRLDSGSPSAAPVPPRPARQC